MGGAKETTTHCFAGKKLSHPFLPQRDLLRVLEGGGKEREGKREGEGRRKERLKREERRVLEEERRE